MKTAGQNPAPSQSAPPAHTPEASPAPTETPARPAEARSEHPPAPNRSPNRGNAQSWETLFTKWPAGKMFAAEFVVAAGINSWQALKVGIVPFPGVITRTGIAFGILSLVYYIDEDLAGLLGAGFLLALIVGQASGGFDTFAALDPSDSSFFYLTFGPAANASATGPTTNGLPAAGQHPGTTSGTG